MLFIPLSLALLLDRIFAEPTRFHPLVGFGHWAAFCESKLYAEKSYFRGFLALILVISPILLVCVWINALLALSLFSTIFSAVILYLCIGWQSLLAHADAIAKPLAADKLIEAREKLSYIVSRDTEQIDAIGIVKASSESVLENGADAIFNAIFWFAIAGVPGVVLYRMANTLDAMWGYKNSRYYYFGFAAAKLDDLLNYIPARLTALMYLLVSKQLRYVSQVFQQSKHWKSSNAGCVMSAGAFAVKASLGGAAVYHGSLQQRPILGFNKENEVVDNRKEKTDADTIFRCMRLINKSVLFILLIILFSDLVRFMYCPVDLTL